MLYLIVLGVKWWRRVVDGVVVIQMAWWRAIVAFSQSILMVNDFLSHTICLKTKIKW